MKVLMILSMLLISSHLYAEEDKDDSDTVKAGCVKEIADDARGSDNTGAIPGADAGDGKNKEK